MRFSLNSAKAFAAAGLLVLLLADDGARAQQPTPEQTSAIRASCRSDFMANCSGVQPGGKDALECLKRNLAKLSGACNAAVSAISPAPAAPAAAEAPRPAAPSPQPAATATPAPSTASHPVAKPAASLAQKPGPAAPAAATASAPPAAPAAAAVPQGPDVMVLRPREALRIVRICAADQRVFCAGVPPGGGRIVECLVRNAPSLSPQCKDALAMAR